MPKLGIGLNLSVPRVGGGATAPAGIPSSASSLHAYFAFYGISTFGNLSSPVLFNRQSIDPSGNGSNITFSNYDGYFCFITWMVNSWAVGFDYGKGFAAYMYTKSTYAATSSVIPTDPNAWAYDSDYTAFVITA
jgi:hypothetical protein